MLQYKFTCLIRWHDGCTTLTLTKRMEKKLDSNYTRMLRAIFNKCWRQHPTKQQLCGHLPSITKTIQVRRTRHTNTAGEVRTNSWATYPDGAFHMDEQRRDNQLESIYNSSVAILDIALKTYRERWMIETGGERGSGDRSVLAAWHDDDEFGKVVN